MLTTLMIAVLAFLVIGGVGFVLAGGGDSSQARTLKRAQAVAGGGPQAARARARVAANTPDVRRKQILKSLKEQEKRQKQASLTLGARIQQAGLNLRPRTFWMISGGIGAAVLLLALVLRQHVLIGLGAAFAAGFGLPRWVLTFLAKRRSTKFTASFSDALDIIVRGIKSGLPVHDCLRIIGAETPEPMSGEFRRLNEAISMGVTIDQALEKMYERMPTSELRFFIIVLVIQAKTGGNLAEALGNLSTVLRSRKLMREKIKALSSEAIASASIIGVLPPGVCTMILITSPDYMKVMFTDPRGNIMLAGAAFWMALGIFTMRKMINFRF
jgi:tight adherence protein B